MGGIVQPEQEQMERYAEAFYSLAELFQKLPGQKERLNDEDLRILFEDVRERVCAACGNGKQCWNESYYDKCRMLYELLKEMERSGTFSMIQKKQLSDICERPQQLALALRTGYEEARTNLLWSNRMMEQRRAAGEQIYQTAELLKHTAEGFTGMPEQEQRIARRLRRELFFLNTEMDAIRVFLRETGRMEIYLTLHAGKRTVVSVKSIAEALSDCCGINMRPAFDCRTAVTLTPAIFHFVPDTRYQFLCGIARITKAGEMVSGDNYTLLQKDSGKVVMSLADGMGSCTAANHE
ncbi:MAG: hypothetical protein LUH07_14865, partial [Lachnospiraceae bacterium]|nr:hypothetical protein [Lachnospiraceae bacterium]